MAMRRAVLDENAAAGKTPRSAFDPLADLFSKFGAGTPRQLIGGTPRSLLSTLAGTPRQLLGDISSQAVNTMKNTPDKGFPGPQRYEMTPHASDNGSTNESSPGQEWWTDDRPPRHSLSGLDLSPEPRSPERPHADFATPKDTAEPEDAPREPQVAPPQWSSLEQRRLERRLAKQPSNKAKDEAAAQDKPKAQHSAKAQDPPAASAAPGPPPEAPPPEARVPASPASAQLWASCSRTASACRSTCLVLSQQCAETASALVAPLQGSAWAVGVGALVVVLAMGLKPAQSPTPQLYF